MKRIIEIVFLMFFLTGILCSGSVLGESPARKPVTLMIYMTGSNLETDYGAASADISEMLKAGINGREVNVLLMTGGSRSWRNGQQDADTIQISQLHQQSLVRRWSAPAMNMGDAETLTFFLNYVSENYPAEEYALIFWDHGGGPMEGVCFDETRAMDSLSLSEIRSALDSSRLSGRLSWIGFDACLMCALETAYMCAPYADYMIASQETEPETGWDYSFLKELGKKSSRSLCELIVDGYGQAQSAGGAHTVYTLSCIDLRKITALTEAMNSMFSSLTLQLDRKTFSEISGDRFHVKSLGQTTLSDYDLTDLYYLAEQYRAFTPEEAEQLQKAIGEAIVCRTGNQDYVAGLSIYSPWYNKDYYTGKWAGEYKSFAVSTAYLDYISRYAEIWLGEQLADWRGLTYSAFQDESGLQNIRLEMTAEQAAHFASAKVVILRETGQGQTYYNIYEIDDVRREGNTLLAGYDYNALYVLDESGQPLTDSFSFERVDDYYNIEVALETQSLFNLTQVYQNDAEQAGYEARSAVIQCKKAEGEDRLEIVNITVRTGSKEELTLSRQSDTLDIEKWRYIFFVNHASLTPAYSPEGSLLPATQWPEVETWDARHNDVVNAQNEVLKPSEWVMDFAREKGEQNEYRFWGEVPAAGVWSLSFVHEAFSGMGLYAQYIITDTQGNEIATDLILLRQPNLLSSQGMDMTVFDDQDIEVVLTGVRTVGSELDSGINFQYTISNDSDFACAFAMSGIIVNNVSIFRNIGFAQYVEPHSSVDLYMMLPKDNLPALKDGVVRSVSFYAVVGIIPPGGPVTFNNIFTTKRIHLPLYLDVSDIGPMREWPYPDTVLGETVTRGVRTQLLSLREQPDGQLAGILHLINESGEDRNIYSNSQDGYPHLVINGYYMPNCLAGFFSQVCLPVRGEAYAEFTIRRTSYSRLFDHLEDTGRMTQDIFDYWEISAVESIGFLFDITDEIEYGYAGAFRYPVTIRLRDPLPLDLTPEKRPGVIRIANTEDAVVNLCGALYEEDRIRLYVDIHPGSSADLIVSLKDCTVDGKAAGRAAIALDRTNSYSAGPVQLFGGVSERAIIELTPADQQTITKDTHVTLGFEFCTLHRYTVAVSDPVQIWPFSKKTNLGEYLTAGQLRVKK